MNALEVTQKTEEALIKTINESGLPLTTIHYMLQDLQRQVADALTKSISPTESEAEETNGVHEDNVGE